MNLVVIIIIILFAIALMLWLIFGINWRGVRNYNRKHQRLRARMNDEYAEDIQKLLFTNKYVEYVKPHFQPLTKMLSLHGRPCVSNSEVEIITTGKRKFELLVQDIQNAKESIHIEYFHFGIDDGSRYIRKLLMQKAREGVKVRFINENIANFPIPNIYFYSMRQSGVEVVNFTNNGISLLKFLLTLSYRDHRKIVVIDGKIGYTGGMNINNHYFYQWRDTHLRLTGNAVAALQFTFLDTWLAAGGKLQPALVEFFPMLKEVRVPQGRILTQITPDEPTSPEPLLLMAYEWILSHARQYVWFQSPYLAPPQALVDAIAAAVKRGVEIKIMIPKKCDTPIMRPINKSYYKMLLEAGVKLYERNAEFIHSKTIVCDDYLSCVGTTNLDNRSFQIDYEINTFFFDTETALQLKDTFEAEMPICKQISLIDIESTSVITPMKNKILHKIAQIL